ncbi:MAG: hypothetical protein ACN4IE_03375, partial [Ilumatobacter sp.]
MGLPAVSGVRAAERLCQVAVLLSVDGPSVDGAVRRCARLPTRGFAPRSDCVNVQYRDLASVHDTGDVPKRCCVAR